MNEITNEITDEITLGDVTIARVEETHGPVGMTPGQFFPGWPEQDWQDNRSWLAPDHLGVDDDIVRVAFQAYVVRSQGRVILVDTGIGNDKTRPAVGAWDHLSTGFLDNLAAAGIRPRTWTWSSTRTCTSTTSAGTPGWSDGSGCRRSPTPPTSCPALDFEHFDPAKNPDIAGGVNENAFEDSIEPVRAAGPGPSVGGRARHRRQPDTGRRPRSHPGIQRPEAVLTRRPGPVRRRPDPHPASGHAHRPQQLLLRGPGNRPDHPPRPARLGGRQHGAGSARAFRRSHRLGDRP